MRIRIRQSFGQRFGSDLFRLFGHRSDRREGTARDEISTKRREGNGQRHGEVKYFDDLAKRAAHVCFVAEHADNDAAFMHARGTFHQAHVKVALQFDGVKAERGLEWRWQRLLDVGLTHRPVAKQELLVF